ncbi:polysaccharide deacetylase family protein [Patescibacteria group bacterium]
MQKLKKIIKDIFYTVIAPFNFKGAIILMYHSIGYNKEFCTVTPEKFKQQMEFLKEKKFNVIKLVELAEQLKNGTLKPKTIIITLDDGYEDNYLNAYPILKEFNFPVTIFVPSALIGTTVKSKKGECFKILNFNAMREMEESGLVEIGSHSHNHIKLSQLSDKELNKQFRDSKNILQEGIGKPVTSIAYPFGSFNDSVKNLAKNYYSIGCSVRRGRICDNSKNMELKRNPIDRDVTFIQFKGIVKFGRI